MKNKLLISAALVFVSIGAAHAAGNGPDFSGISPDATTVLAAISGAAAIKFAPGFARWGYNKLIGWFR